MASTNCMILRTSTRGQLFNNGFGFRQREEASESFITFDDVSPFPPPSYMQLSHNLS